MTRTDMMVEVLCRQVALPRHEGEIKMAKAVHEINGQQIGMPTLDLLERQRIGYLKDDERVLLTSPERAKVAKLLREWRVEVYRGNGASWHVPTKIDIWLRENRRFRIAKDLEG